MEMSSITPQWQMWHGRRGTKLWTCFYYVAQVAPNTRGLCSVSSVQKSCTAGHESPFWGIFIKKHSRAPEWLLSDESWNKIMKKVTNVFLPQGSFPVLLFWPVLSLFSDSLGGLKVCNNTFSSPRRDLNENGTQVVEWVGGEWGVNDLSRW